MATGLDVANWMRARIGKYFYTQNMTLRASPDTSGGTDCSALIDYAYEQVSGSRIGGNTDAQMKNGTSVFGTDMESMTQARELLMPGDVIFFRWNNPPEGAYWSHEELALGGDTTIGHGGDPFYGPVMKSFAQQWGWASHIAARRYLPLTETTTPEEESPTVDQETINKINDLWDWLKQGKAGSHFPGVLAAELDQVLTTQGAHGSSLGQLKEALTGVENRLIALATKVEGLDTGSVDLSKYTLTLTPKEQA